MDLPGQVEEGREEGKAEIIRWEPGRHLAKKILKILDAKPVGAARP
jgi:hypothetical protein